MVITIKFGKILVIHGDLVVYFSCDIRSLGFVQNGSHAQVAATKVSLQRWTAEGLEPQGTQSLRSEDYQ